MKQKRQVLIHKNKDEVKRPIRFNKEPGRNQPCKCGSEKKYKHCCLPKLEAGEAKLIINANKN